MKFPFAPRKKKKAGTKMNAATATTAGGRSRAREVEEYEEPNVSLSSAVVVVLILHVVLVGAIFAFNSIKSHREAATEEPVVPRHVQAEAPAPASSEQNTVASEDTRSAMMPAANIVAPKTYHVRSGDTLTKIAAANGVSVDDMQQANELHGPLRVGQVLHIPAATGATATTHPAAAAASPAKAVSGLKDAGTTYTVAKGENPVVIARKLHVNYDDLLKLNKIEDPKKLRIGQKLKIPAKRTTS
jgi:LysM repeat protein